MTEIQWWPHGRPIPDGWAEVGEPPVTHHHHYGRMIERVAVQGPPETPALVWREDGVTRAMRFRDPDHLLNHVRSCLDALAAWRR